MSTPTDDDLCLKAVQLYRAYGQPADSAEEPILLSALKFYELDLDEEIDLRTTGPQASEEVLALAARRTRVEELIKNIEGAPQG